MKTSLLYETYNPISRARRLDIIRYPIPFPKTVGCGTTTQPLDFPKVPPGTIIHTVNLKATGDLVTSGTPITPVSAEVVFLVNGQTVASKGISICTIYRCTAPFDFYTNIGAYVYFGERNDFAVEVRQSFSPVGCVTGVENLSAYVEIDYTGTPPGPPKPPPPEWWGYVKWGLLGLGVIAVGTTLIKVAPELMKKR